MTPGKTLRGIFKRYRRPGDSVFAWLALVFSILLLAQLFEQTTWRQGSELFAQPRFWPALALSGMTLFATLHLAGSLLSERIPGRWQEVLVWLKAFEYAAWLIVYAAALPYVGYLPGTVLFAVLLVLRVGYRSKLALGSAALSGLIVVLLFKTLLKVSLPVGEVYDLLPDGLRQIMINHF